MQTLKGLQTVRSTFGDADLAQQRNSRQQRNSQGVTFPRSQVGRRPSFFSSFSITFHSGLHFLADDALTLRSFFVWVRPINRGGAPL